MSETNLRPYQRECIDRLVGYRRSPAQGGAGLRALVGLPTGCGKTVIFAQLPKLAKKRVMVIAHREELLEQAAGHLAQNNPGKTVAIEQAGRNAGAADIVVASIQTLASSGGSGGVERGGSRFWAEEDGGSDGEGVRRRLQRFDPQDFSLIIVDEAHHATARTYLQALNHFGLAPDVSDLKDADLGRKKLSAELKARFGEYQVNESAPFLAGFTATPHRTDGQGLEAVFDEIVYSKNIEEMIRDGWLCPVRGKLIETGADISHVRTRMGDFQEKQLSQAVNTPERNKLAASSYLEHADGRQALVFCVDVGHVQEMTKIWGQMGISCAAVTGETPREERRRAIAAYRSGDIRALINCMVLTEGFDAPETSCIVMARPTSSGLIYTQAMGRGTRIAPGKENLLVLDLVDLQRRGAQVQNSNTLFGLPPQLDTGVLGALEAKEAIQREYEGKIPLFMLDDVKSIAEIAGRVREFNPLEASRYDPQLAGARFQWVNTSYGYTCNLMGQGSLGVVVDLLGHASVRYQKPGHAVQAISGGGGQVFSGENAVNDAIKWAEAWVTGQAPSEVREVAGAIKKDARWHGDPATGKQVNLMKLLGLPRPDGLTKGWASYLIDQAKADPQKAGVVQRMEQWQRQQRLDVK